MSGLEEYARRHGVQIREAFNRLDDRATRNAIDDAESTVEAGRLSPEDRRRFWKIVQQEFNNGRLVMKADNSAFFALLRAVQEAIEAGQKT